MDDLASYSLENRRKIKIVLELLIDALELKNPLDKFALKLPQNKIKKHDIEYYEVLRIFDWISQKGRLFTVLNEKHRRLVRESDPLMSDWEVKNVALKDVYYQLNVREEDLKEYFLIEVKDSGIKDKLRQIKDSIEVSLEDQQESESSNNAQPKLFNWKPDYIKHRGQLYLKNLEPLNFYSGNFGGVDLLITNIGHDVTTNDLREAIQAHTRGNKTVVITITDWKYKLRTRRPLFVKFFNIEYFPPNKHRLTYIGPQ